MILDKDSRTGLGTAVTELLRDKSQRETISTNIRRMALENSDERIVDELLKLVNDREGKK